MLIVYYSRFGAVRSLAEHVAEGARRVPDIETEMLEVEDLPIEALRPGETCRGHADAPRDGCRQARIG